MKNTFICPYCYIGYTQDDYIDDKRCFDCLCEGNLSFVIPRRQFIKSIDLATLASIRTDFKSSTRHCPSRRDQIVERIDHLILELPVDHRKSNSAPAPIQSNFPFS
ncbi:hypothetical protein QEH56_16120 [Pelagicoccus enzymogenes]|uniref:hypothetical protein n=1 Tax=Pelagicoccus enzymogenes TaxID=2773457 RepID=UPI00281069AA|nr:hypothetical protein [Pelagicoccus enzymogenes]MDQ8199689.1 hypothetical protein [Pelagicoccus enzymogenes]